MENLCHRPSASVLTSYKYQPNFNLILDIPPEKQGAVRIGRLHMFGVGVMIENTFSPNPPVLHMAYLFVEWVERFCFESGRKSAHEGDISLQMLVSFGDV